MTWRPQRFRVGAMRERINVETPTHTVDAFGQSIPTWAVTYRNEPAAFDMVSGGETFRGKQVESGINAVFTVHWRDGYDTTQRIAHNGTNYGIVYVKYIEGGRRYIELWCKS